MTGGFESDDDMSTVVRGVFLLLEAVVRWGSVVKEHTDVDRRNTIARVWCNNFIVFSSDKGQDTKLVFGSEIFLWRKTRSVMGAARKIVVRSKTVTNVESRTGDKKLKQQDLGELVISLFKNSTIFSEQINPSDDLIKAFGWVLHSGHACCHKKHKKCKKMFEPSGLLEPCGLLVSCIKTGTMPARRMSELSFEFFHVFGKWSEVRIVPCLIDEQDFLHAKWNLSSPSACFMT